MLSALETLGAMGYIKPVFGARGAWGAPGPLAICTESPGSALGFLGLLGQTTFSGPVPKLPLECTLFT